MDSRFHVAQSGLQAFCSPMEVCTGRKIFRLARLEFQGAGDVGGRVRRIATREERLGPEVIPLGIRRSPGRLFNGLIREGARRGSVQDLWKTKNGAAIVGDESLMTRTGYVNPMGQKEIRAQDHL